MCSLQCTPHAAIPCAHTTSALPLPQAAVETLPRAARSLRWAPASTQCFITVHLLQHAHPRDCHPLLLYLNPDAKKGTLSIACSVPSVCVHLQCHFVPWLLADKAPLVLLRLPPLVHPVPALQYTAATQMHITMLVVKPCNAGSLLKGVKHQQAHNLTC